jgi:putative transposase
MIHQRKSPRRKDYDYSSPWWYFITICTKNREHYFGEIIDKMMNLSEIGTICAQEIKDTTKRRSHIRIDEYIVMPNHIHILMIIGGKPYPIENNNISNPVDNISNDVGTYGNTSLSNNTSNIQDALPRVPTKQPIESLWSIIRNIKSRVTKYANQHDIIFARQPLYHDHIIRNEQEYQRIKYYIQTNPQNRDNDSLQ